MQRNVFYEPQLENSWREFLEGSSRYCTVLISITSMLVISCAGVYQVDNGAHVLLPGGPIS